MLMWGKIRQRFSQGDFCRIFTRLQRQRNVHNMEYITHTDQTLSARLAASERILIGIGPEWGLKSEKKKIRDCRLSDPEQAEIKAAYEARLDSYGRSGL